MVLWKHRTAFCSNSVSRYTCSAGAKIISIDSCCRCTIDIAARAALPASTLAREWRSGSMPECKSWRSPLRWRPGTLSLQATGRQQRSACRALGVCVSCRRSYEYPRYSHPHCRSLVRDGSRCGGQNCCTLDTFLVVMYQLLSTVTSMHLLWRWAQVLSSMRVLRYEQTPVKITRACKYTTW